MDSPEITQSIGQLAEIKSRYGVEIPASASRKYKDGSRENIIPSPEEIRIIGDTIAKIPAAGELSQFLLLYRGNPGIHFTSGGQYLGHDWPNIIGPRPADNWERLRNPLPFSKKSAIRIDLPREGTKMSDVAFRPQEYVMENEIPQGTQAEVLAYVVAHEFGHGLDLQVTRARFKIDEEYRRNFDTSLPYSWNIADNGNPLHKSFAKLTHWKLVTFMDWARREDELSGTYSGLAEVLEEKEGDTLMWDRDEIVWGDAAHRRKRIGFSATYKGIDEAFADFWAASILAPELLTEPERKYFGIIHDGLKSNPKQFIEALAHDQIDFQLDSKDEEMGIEPKQS